MNKKLSLAVAGAVLAFGASAANAGIVIPAGDWTVDLGGNVNAFYSHTKVDGGGAASNTIGSGLLPSALGIGAKTRQNDLDIAFQFTFFTGSSSGTNTALASNTLNIRQAYLTFGDASWGSIKAGRDLGIFGSDAILSDMTLLGVGGNLAPGGSSTLGRIGQGYIYADWFGQISYTSPNWNGFSFTGGVFEPVNTSATTGAGKSSDMMYQGKVTYEWAGDYAGKVWLGGTTQSNTNDITGNSFDSQGWDLGGKVNVVGVGLVGYYYDGTGLASIDRTSVGTSAYGRNVLMGGINGTDGTRVDSDDKGGYVQATYVVPGIGTKLGASWGESKSTYAGDEAQTKTWILGAYHPLTKSLNLVAEYANAKNEYTGQANVEVKSTTLGAILFF
jgi:hypothetical protein